MKKFLLKFYLRMLSFVIRKMIWSCKKITLHLFIVNNIDFDYMEKLKKQFSYDSDKNLDEFTQEMLNNGSITLSLARSYNIVRKFDSFSKHISLQDYINLTNLENASSKYYLKRLLDSQKNTLDNKNLDEGVSCTH